MDSGDVLVGAFGEAVPVTLREMAGVEAVVREFRQGAVARAVGIAALLRLGAEADFVLDVPAAVAAELSCRVFAQSGVEADDGMVRDCVGEVANVIAGQAKTLLYGTPRHFVFSTPQAVPGALPEPTTNRGVLAFASEIGEFFVYLRAPG